MTNLTTECGSWRLAPASLKLLLLAAALPLTSCEDVVELNVPQGQALLVVDGAITDQAGPYVIKLSQTAPYFENQVPPPVTGAQMVLTSSDGQRETLQERAPGEYVTSGQLHGQVGGRYTLAIAAAGEQYEAETEIRRALPIDSIRAEYRPEIGLDEAGYYILYYGQEPAGRGDFYRFQVYQNGVLRNRPVDLFAVANELVDGNYLRGLEINEDPDEDVFFVPGDQVRVDVLSLPADYYYFLNEVGTQINNGGLFASPPANVRTNVRNLSAGSTKKAVGYFAGYSLRTATITVR
jgi:Domain of unknown function (DUF4249)